ncbi:MAG TPA: FHA domain-containing protein [Vicinamibacterales bacterium]
MWILRTSGTEIEPLTFRMSSGAVKTIGRAKGADLIIDAALVSRVHCRLEAGKDGVAVTDLSSTNGTFVNGRRVERATLANGDTLRIGRVELTLERSGGRNSIPS